jgi:hypothetical protein
MAHQADHSMVTSAPGARPAHTERPCLRVRECLDRVLRLVGMILAEQDDEWQDGRRYFRPETTTAIDAFAIEEVGQPLLLAG